MFFVNVCATHGSICMSKYAHDPNFSCEYHTVLLGFFKQSWRWESYY